MTVDGIDAVGVHETVEAVFPPEAMVDELSDGDVDVRVVEDRDGAPDDCDAVVTFAHRDEFLAAVDWVHSIQAGYDRFPLEAFEERGVALTNSSGIHGESVGETAIGMMLAHARRLHEYVENQRDRRWSWPEWGDAFTVAGEELCVVGLGTIGRGIARRADALGMDVTGVRRSAEPVEGVERVYAPDELRTAIEGARFVALTVPLTDETRDMIGEAELAAMDDDAVLVNVARGGVVDQDALVDALRGGEIGGAALDVFEEEPLPDESPLWEMGEVIVTPHAAGATVDYHRDVAEIVRENLGRIEAGEELYNRVV